MSLLKEVSRSCFLHGRRVGNESDLNKIMVINTNDISQYHTPGWAQQTKQARKSSEDTQVAGYARFEQIWAG